jgi:hypothetical protein
MDDKDAGTKHGGINTGGGSITGYNDVVAGDKTEIVRGNKAVGMPLPAETLDHLFHPITNLLQSAPAKVQPAAAEKVQQLKSEVAKGKGANDGLMAKLIEGLVSLVPGAVSAVASAFGTPLLSGLAGPATKYVLNKIQGK